MKTSGKLVLPSSCLSYPAIAELNIAFVRSQTPSIVYLVAKDDEARIILRQFYAKNFR